ncbi:arylsulfatase J-like isoform X2 [Anticarsia gemmatalis]
MDRAIVYLLLTICTMTASRVSNKRNIVFIFADDMGWNDVSFHGSDQILTPNIDLLALSGVGFGRYYSHPICTPSRSAFLTGKYAYHLGMQGYPLSLSEDRALPVDEKLLPEYLKEAGYATHLVGKWHVGSSRNEHLPTSRGFDSHFGHRGGYMDYYEYTVEETFSPVGTVSGFALYDNLTAAWDVEGYITDVYTERATSIIKNHDESSPLFLMVGHNAPHSSNKESYLQAPPEVVRQMRHVELTSRRMLAAMVKKLDDSVGEIVKALLDKGILDNTIIVFVSDNGGMTSGQYNNYASNYPLRGIKMSPYEGGVRVAGLVWSTNLNNTSHYWDGYMHVIDWLPTLLSAIGEEVPSGIDGINQWENINNNAPSERNTIYEIDDYTGYGSIILGNFKLITGTPLQSYSTHQGADLRGVIGKAPSYTDGIVNSTVYNVLKLFGRQFDTSELSMRGKYVIECDAASNTICFPSNETVCLFNIKEDPCELTDLSEDYPELAEKMKAMLENEAATRIPRKVPAEYDPESIPSLHGYTWTTWLPDDTSST